MAPLEVIRQLMGWINTIPADVSSIQKALKAGDSIGLFPGTCALCILPFANGQIRKRVVRRVLTGFEMTKLRFLRQIRRENR